MPKYSEDTVLKVSGMCAAVIITVVTAVAYCVGKVVTSITDDIE